MENQKKYNPNLGGAFSSNMKNGKKGIILQIDEAAYKAIMENLRVGSAILLTFNKVTSKGNDHYFTEIMPPFEKKAATPPEQGTSGID